MQKMIFVATVPAFYNFFKGQIKFLSSHFDIVLVSSPQESLLEEISTREGVRSSRIRIHREISFINDLVSLYKLIKLFRFERPHIVHGNTPKGAMLSMLAARFCGVPKRIYMCHGLRYEGASGMKRMLLIKAERLTCYCATEVVCVSNSVKEKLNSDNICKKDKSCVVFNGSCNGINTSLFDRNNLNPSDVINLKHNLNINGNNFIFTYIGRITRDKGINEMLQAFDLLSANHANITLILAGDIENVDQTFNTESKIILKNNPNIVMSGFMDDVRALLAMTEVLLLPSYREGLGMVILEAASMEVPSIASKVTGCIDAIEDGVTGLLVEPRNPSSLFHAMSKLYINQSLRAQLGLSARKNVQIQFPQQKIWGMYMEQYSK